jgi:hypothetical protein
MRRKHRRHRTSAREISAFRVRVAELLRKEARCPGCAKSSRLKDAHPEQPNNIVAICEAHQRIRWELTQ